MQITFSEHACERMKERFPSIRFMVMGFAISANWHKRQPACRGDERFYVPIRIGGRNCHAIVSDTGNVITVCDEAMESN